MANPDSVTGAYLSGRIQIPVPEKRRTPNGWLVVKGARENNLKNVDVSFPLGVLTCVTGVSGSGKSSLVNEILYKSLAKKLNRARTIPGLHKSIEGMEQLDKVICIDQSPIGRTPRSNPATYTGVFDMIRDLFASTSDAKARGYKNNRHRRRRLAVHSSHHLCPKPHFLQTQQNSISIIQTGRARREDQVPDLTCLRRWPENTETRRRTQKSFFCSILPSLSLSWKSNSTVMLGTTRRSFPYQSRSPP